MSYEKVIQLPSRAERFYKDVLKILNENRVPYLIGGSVALAHYMHLTRTPKDLDLFLRKEDCDLAMRVLGEYGYRTEVLHGHWLAKAWYEDLFIDLIFCSGNGIAQVDDTWFANSVSVRMWKMPVRLCSAEDLVWSKGFIMDRERFDGADIAHLIRDAWETINWRKLLDRFGDHWRVLLSHLLLVDYIYPSEKVVPFWLTEELTDRVRKEAALEADQEKICRGTLLSRDQYMTDVEVHGFEDGRLEPNGKLSAEQLDEYTTYIKTEQARLAAEKAQKSNAAAAKNCQESECDKPDGEGDAAA